MAFQAVDNIDSRIKWVLLSARPRAPASLLRNKSRGRAIPWHGLALRWLTVCHSTTWPDTQTRNWRGLCCCCMYSTRRGSAQFPHSLLPWASAHDVWWVLHRLGPFLTGCSSTLRTPGGQRKLPTNQVKKWTCYLGLFCHPTIKSKS